MKVLKLIYSIGKFYFKDFLNNNLSRIKISIFKIYKEKSCYTGDFVAIKAIDKMCFQESVEDVLLMIRQTEVLKILKHRNLVSLYEIIESENNKKIAKI